MARVGPNSTQSLELYNILMLSILDVCLCACPMRHSTPSSRCLLCEKSAVRGEHPLDSRKWRSNFAGVSTLGVGYALRWCLNHRPNFILASKLWWFLPDSPLTASGQPPNNHLTATRKLRRFLFLGICVFTLVFWFVDSRKCVLGKKCFFSWQLVDSLLVARQHSGSQGVSTLCSRDQLAACLEHMRGLAEENLGRCRWYSHWQAPPQSGCKRT